MLNNSILKKLENIVEKIPEKIGIYMFKDSKSNYLYVGKSKNIRKRIKSHIQSKNVKNIQFLKRTEEIDFLLTEAEEDALILESDLIDSFKLSTSGKTAFA